MPERTRLVRRVLPVLAIVIAAAVVVVIANTDAGRTSVISSPSAAATSSPPQPPSLTPQHASPSPAPQPRAGSWTALRWSAPSLIPGLLTVVSWHDGFVAVADVPGPDGHVGAAFTSSDALRWERTATFASTPNIVATATGLVAVVNSFGASPSIETWVSADGKTWQRQERLALAGATFFKIAARDRTIVAAGVDATGRAKLWSSTDGAQWSQGQVPASRAIVRGVSAVGDGFLAVGRDGEPDTGSGGVGVRGIGRPAGWGSADGRTWDAVRVDGVDAVGAELFDVFRVADAFFAIGSDSNANPRGPALWISVDARDWSLVGSPPHWGLASANGKQAVVFGFADFGTAELGAWSSIDGRDWTRLSFTGDVADIPGFQQDVGHASRVDQIFVVSRGVIVIGQQNGQLTIWFAEAIGP